MAVSQNLLFHPPFCQCY